MASLPVRAMLNAQCRMLKEAPDARLSFSIQHSSISIALLFLKLAQGHSKRPKLLLDFVQARLAEVFAPEQFVFGAGGQLAQAVDVEPLQRLSGADGQLEVGHRLVHELRRNVGNIDRRATHD